MPGPGRVPGACAELSQPCPLPPPVTGPAGKLRLQQQRPRSPAPIRRRGQELVGPASSPHWGGVISGVSRAVPAPPALTGPPCPPTPGTGHAVQGRWRPWPTTASAGRASPTTPKSEVRGDGVKLEISSSPVWECRSPGGAALGVTGGSEGPPRAHSPSPDSILSASDTLCLSCTPHISLGAPRGFSAQPSAQQDRLRLCCESEGGKGG